MKKSLTLILFFAALFCKGQNLVPNPSFEDTVSCPNFGGQVWKAQYWQTVANSPDYFHSCNPFYDFSVPYNFVGYQPPSTGEAYMGLWIYQEGQPYRELLGTNLLAPLVIGQRYYINFKVCLSFNANYSNHGACNNMGILFSTANFLNSSFNVTNYCQVKSDSIIADSINWTSVSGSFIADSAYTYISFGNFFSNDSTDTLHLMPSNAYRAYYYLDDVCVSTDSNYCQQWTGILDDNFENNLKIYPQPSTGKIVMDNIPIGWLEMKLINQETKVLKTIKSSGEKSIQINLESYNAGLYIIKINTKKNIITKKIILTN